MSKRIIFKSGSPTIYICTHNTQIHTLCNVISRETREGWPLLTVETEVNGDSKSTTERSPSLVCLVSFAGRAGTQEFCSALAALVSSVENICFLTVHYFNSFVPIAQQTRRLSPVS